jgi:hypothetical protein
MGSAADGSHRNRRVSFKSDVQESLKLLDTKPSLILLDMLDQTEEDNHMS